MEEAGRQVRPKGPDSGTDFDEVRDPTFGRILLRSANGQYHSRNKISIVLYRCRSPLYGDLCCRYTKADCRWGSRVLCASSTLHPDFTFNHFYFFGGGSVLHGGTFMIVILLLHLVSIILDRHDVAYTVCAL
jgi:hypothetical protein